MQRIGQGNQSNKGRSSRMTVIKNAGVKNPETEEQTIAIVEETQTSGPVDPTTPTHRVILYNDEWHGMDEVILQLQKATGCDLSKAEMIAFEAHFKGRAVCYKGSRDQCQRVAGILRQIRLQCEIDCD